MKRSFNASGRGGEEGGRAPGVTLGLVPRAPGSAVVPQEQEGCDARHTITRRAATESWILGLNPRVTRQSGGRAVIAWVADRLRWRVHAKVQAEVHAEHGFAMTLRHDAPP